MSRTCTRTSCTRPRRSRATRRCCAESPGAAPRTRRTSGRFPIGRSGRSSRPVRWTATCTAGNAQHLRALAGATAQIDLVYHGIDTNRFPAPSAAGRASDGSASGSPVTILSVGRAVDKKGYDDLLHALALLSPGALAFRAHRRRAAGGRARRASRASSACTSASGGAARRRMPRCSTPTAPRTSSCSPCRISGDGDRDGLPNVLLEAPARACPASPPGPEPSKNSSSTARRVSLVPPAIAPPGRRDLRLIADPARAPGSALPAKPGASAISFDPGIDQLAAKFAQRHRHEPSLLRTAQAARPPGPPPATGAWPSF